MKILFPVAATVIAAALPLSAAEINGKVTLKGTPPPAAVIAAVKADANCGKVAVGEAKSRVYVVGANGALANTVVYIKKGLEGKTFPAPAAKADPSKMSVADILAAARGGKPAAATPTAAPAPAAKEEPAEEAAELPRQERQQWQVILHEDGRPR